jgi:hypothetical protein
MDGQESVHGAQVMILNRGDMVETDTEGRFVFAYLQTGQYDIEVQVDGRKAKQYKIEVPSPTYDLTL